MRENRIFKIFIAVLAIYAILGFFILPTVLKPQLEKIINQNITKTATIQGIAFNPFTFMFKIKGLKIADEQKEIISFSKFYIDFSLLKSIHKRHFSFKNLILEDAKINIVEDENAVINLTTIVKPTVKSEESTKSEEKNSIIDFMVLKTQIKNATITYTKNGSVDPFYVSIDKLNYTFYDFGSYKHYLASHTLETYINKYTKLTIHGGLRVEPFTMYANVSLKNLKPAQFLSYKKSMLNFDLSDDTRVDLDFGYQVDMKKGLDVKVQKLHLNVKDFYMTQEDKSVVKFKNFALNNLNLFYPSQKIDIDSVKLDSLDTNIITSKDGILNLANLIKEEKQLVQKEEQTIEKAQETKPWFINLKDFDIANTFVKYSDFKTNNFVKTENINLNINAFALKGEDVDIKRVTLAKPNILYKNTSTKQSVQTKEIEVALYNIKKQNSEISVNSLDIKEPSVSFKDTKNALDVKTKDLKVNIKDIKKLDETITVGALALAQPYLSYRNGKSKDNLQVKNTNVDISNIKLLGQDIDIESLKVAKPDIVYKNSKSKLDVKTDDLKVTLQNISKKANNISVKKLKLVEPKVNIKDKKTLKYINIAGVNLNLDAVSYKNSIANIKKISFKKKSMYFEDKKTKNKITSKNINLKVNRLKYADNRLDIRSSSLYRPYIAITLPRKPKAQTKKEEETKKEVAKKKVKKAVKKTAKKDDFRMEIGPFKIKNAKLRFEDKNLPIPFRTLVSSLHGDFSAFSTTSSKPTKLKLEGKVDKYGYTKITGFVEHEDIKELTDVTLLFKNIAIKNFTPYSGKFLGREIESGKLNLNLKYNIKSSNLDASNSIVISDIKLGKNIESPEAVSLPLELAIALLEDSNGIIDLNLPISGNVDDPKFSIAPIVWKVFTNLIVKAITSPFTLLASLLGVEEDDIKSIEFEYASSSILASEKEALDNIAKILVKRPKLGIKVHPTYDTTNDVDAIKEIKVEKLIDDKIKTIKNKKVDKYKVALESIYATYKKELPLKELQKTFVKKEKDKKPVFETEKYLAKLKDTIKSKQVVTKQQLTALTQRRINAMKTYLINTKKVDAKKITIQEIKEVTKSKNFTKFDLEVDVSK